MLDIIDNINSMFLPANAILVTFDIVNMFPSTDNKSGLDAVKSALLKSSTNAPPVECILEGLELCLTCNNSTFNNRNFLQTGGTAQGPHMSCTYSDIAMSKFDTAALQYHFQPTLWKRFRDNISTIWTHGSDTLESFLTILIKLIQQVRLNSPYRYKVKMGLSFSTCSLKKIYDILKIEISRKITVWCNFFLITA